MSDSDFWEIIERTRREFDPTLHDGNQAKQHILAMEELAELNTRELEDFYVIYSTHFFKLYSWDHWAVAHIIEGGCSDDFFDYFSAWVISMGREPYAMVVSDADNVVEFANLPGIECIFYSEFVNIAGDAYQLKTGLHLPEKLGPGRRESPSGYQWKFDDWNYFESRFPRTWVKFGHEWDTNRNSSD